MNENEMQIGGWVKNIVNESWEKNKCWIQRAESEKSGLNHWRD